MQTKQPADPAAGLHGPDLEIFEGWNTKGPVVLGPRFAYVAHVTRAVCRSRLRATSM